MPLGYGDRSNRSDEKTDAPPKHQTTEYNRKRQQIHRSAIRRLSKRDVIYTGVHAIMPLTAMHYKFMNDPPRYECEKDDDGTYSRVWCFESCKSKCKPPCSYWQYQKSVSYATFPSQVAKYFVANQSEWEELKSTIVLEIYFTDLDYTEIKQVIAMPLQSVIAQIGGEKFEISLYQMVGGFLEIITAHIITSIKIQQNDIPPEPKSRASTTRLEAPTKISTMNAAVESPSLEIRTTTNPGTNKSISDDDLLSTVFSAVVLPEVRYSVDTENAIRHIDDALAGEDTDGNIDDSSLVSDAHHSYPVSPNPRSTSSYSHHSSNQQIFYPESTVSHAKSNVSTVSKKSTGSTPYHVADSIVRHSFKDLQLNINNNENRLGCDKYYNNVEVEAYDSFEPAHLPYTKSENHEDYLRQRRMTLDSTVSINESRNGIYNVHDDDGNFMVSSIVYYVLIINVFIFNYKKKKNYLIINSDSIYEEEPVNISEVAALQFHNGHVASKVGKFSLVIPKMEEINGFSKDPRVRKVIIGGHAASTEDDKTVLFFGPAQSGKTSVINRTGTTPPHASPTTTRPRQQFSFKLLLYYIVLIHCNLI
uniref:C2 domain-containing protein n=1 Tax=Heterorhabditis bacteriophora TaxID=37862 RepID=A0A1I7WNT7_HETBA